MEGQTEENLSLTTGMDVQYVGTEITGRVSVLTREQIETDSVAGGEDGGQPLARGGGQGRRRTVQADGEVNSKQQRRAECNR